VEICSQHQDNRCNSIVLMIQFLCGGGYESMHIVGENHLKTS
jgi:hypothetical protein